MKYDIQKVLATLESMGDIMNEDLPLMPFVSGIDFTGGALVFSLATDGRNLPAALAVWDETEGYVSAFMFLSDSAVFTKSAADYTLKMHVSGKGSPLYRKLFDEAVAATARLFSADEVDAREALARKERQDD